MVVFAVIAYVIVLVALFEKSEAEIKKEAQLETLTMMMKIDQCVFLDQKLNLK